MSYPTYDLTIKQIVERAHQNSKDKGWWDGVADPVAEVPLKIALIHSEASEALEDYRRGAMDAAYDQPDDPLKQAKPVGFPSELVLRRPGHRPGEGRRREDGLQHDEAAQARREEGLVMTDQTQTPDPQVLTIKPAPIERWANLDDAGDIAWAA